MKILFVLEHFYPDKGGVERLFLSLATELAKEYHDITVITSRTDNSQAKEEIYQGIKIIRLPFSNRFLFTFFSLPYILKYANQVDLIHTTSYNAALPAWLASVLTRKKCIITFHEVWDSLWWSLPYYFFGVRLLFYLFEKIILALPFDQYIAVSDSTKKALIKSGIDTRKITMIYNGINYDSFTKCIHEPPQTPTICYYGRLGASKGLDNLLDALQNIKSRYKLLLIIPKQPAFILKQVLKKLEQNQLIDKTTIKHNLSDEELFSTISKTSFVVIPSLCEGFCFNAVECSAMQIPVVASHNTALLETVSGKHIYIQNKDIESSINKALQADWQNIEFKKFELSKTVQEYKELYRRIF
jgi:glycosyltransferase involved in cell wall biosynthesis